MSAAARCDEPDEIVDQPLHLGAGSLRQPVDPEIAGDRGTSLRLARTAPAEVERAPDIRSLGSDPLDRLDLTRIAGTGDDRQGSDPVPMAAEHGDQLAGLLETLPAELAKRLEDPVAPATGAVTALQDGSLDEPRHEVGDPRGGQDVVRAHLRRRAAFEAAREDGEAAPEESLGVVQKLVTPIDRRIERPLAMRARGIAGSQDPEPSGEAIVEGLQAESMEPDRGELDRESHTVELGAHACHGGCIVLVEMEIAIDGLRPLDE